LHPRRITRIELQWHGVKQRPGVIRLVKRRTCPTKSSTHFACERDGAIDMPKPGAPLPPPERLTPEQQGYWHAICPDLPPGHHASSKFVGLHLKKHVDGPVKHGAETLILRRYWDGRANQARFWVKPAAPRGW
jgi:hypothetical protein